MSEARADSLDLLDVVRSVWARDDDASWPRFVRFDKTGGLVAAGASASWRAPSSTPCAVALRAADAVPDTFPLVVGAARFSPRVDDEAGRDDDRWAAFGGAWCFAPRDVVRGRIEPLRAIAPRDVVVRAVATNSYRAAVEAALTRVHDDDDPLCKVVVARAFDVSCSDGRDLRDDVPSLVDALASHVYRAGCGRVFVCAPSRDTIWLGATPERLARIHDGDVDTEAVAGTRPRTSAAGVPGGEGDGEGDDDDSGLLYDDKERREHALVVAHLGTQLQRLGLAPRHDDVPQLRRLPHLVHLVTPVRAALRPGVRAIDVVAALHPTPAMNGTPMREAASFLRQFEDLDRGLYAGCVGVWRDTSASDDDGGSLDVDVGIRGALLTRHGARIFTGSGIVVGSTCDGEDAETRAKARSVCASLGLRVVREDG